MLGVRLLMRSIGGVLAVVLRVGYVGRQSNGVMTLKTASVVVSIILHRMSGKRPARELVRLEDGGNGED